MRLPTLAFSFLITAVCLLAQGGESTEILGVVEDSSGSLMAGVEVTATHGTTAESRKTVTGDSGVYVFSCMRPGEYKLTAGKSGFKTEMRSGLELQINQKARVNFVLQVGAVAESVEVSASV